MCVNFKMADEPKESEPTTSMESLDELVALIWGYDLKEEVFKRWCQGFLFSSDEASALVQLQGGPCAVIAAVQANLMKNMLFSEESTAPADNWRNITDDQVRDMLTCTLCQMLKMVQDEGDTITLALLKDHSPCISTSGMDNDSTRQDHIPDHSSSTEYHISVCEKHLINLSSSELHASIRQITCENMESIRALLSKNIHIFQGHFGILLFLYSLVLTRGISKIKCEMEDSGEPLIDQHFGHGSQTLINLLITGHAVSHIWDFSKEVSGLELKGIPKQSEIGYLTLLEAHRYCEVGSFLKSPQFPIWVLGSETHLTVIFSQDNSLTGTEQPMDEARRVFKSFDQQENGFIDGSKLGNVLEELRLEADPDYVEFMRSRLDPDSVGIILLPNFLEEFFPGQESSFQYINPFTVYHYNGLGFKTDDGMAKKYDNFLSQNETNPLWNSSDDVEQ